MKLAMSVGRPLAGCSNEKGCLYVGCSDGIGNVPHQIDLPADRLLGMEETGQKGCYACMEGRWLVLGPCLRHDEPTR